MEQQQRTVWWKFGRVSKLFLKASDSIKGVLDGTDALLRHLKVGEPPRDPLPKRSFDITEYTHAAAEIGDATKQLQTLLTMLEHDAPAATLLGDAMQGQAERAVDHLSERVIEAFGVLFVGVLLIVVTSRRIWARRTQTRARGAVGSEK
jgi:hypothetical protein